ncbi:MAG: hypothetical protein ACP5GJ_03450 [Nanopusillaceae archaeon]|jgi:hypothetical protein
MVERYVIDGPLYTKYVVGKMFERSNTLTCNFEKEERWHNVYTCETSDGRKFEFSDGAIKLISKYTGNEFNQDQKQITIYNRNQKLNELVKELEKLCNNPDNVCYVAPNITVIDKGSPRNLFAVVRFYKIDKNDEFNRLIINHLYDLNAKVLYDIKITHFIPYPYDLIIGKNIINSFGFNRIDAGEDIALHVKYKVGSHTYEDIQEPTNEYITYPNGVRERVFEEYNIIDGKKIQRGEDMALYHMWDEVRSRTIDFADFYESLKKIEDYESGNLYIIPYVVEEFEGYPEIYLRSIANAKILTDNKDLLMPMAVSIGEEQPKNIYLYNV